MQFLDLRANLSDNPNLFFLFLTIDWNFQKNPFAANFMDYGDFVVLSGRKILAQWLFLNA